MPARRRGSIVIYVVWLVLLLSLLAAGVGARAFATLTLSERLTEQLQATYLLRAGLRAAMAELERDTTRVDSLQDLWADPNGSLREVSLPGGTVRLPKGLQDEERRINLNTAPTDVLERLVQEIGGMRERESVEIAAAIADWRDEDTEERPFGAEGYYYRSLSDAYDCKNASFENVEELLLVKGVSPMLYERLAPWVTVHGSGKLNVNTATSTVLRTLGLSEAGLSGLLLYRVGEDSVEGNTDDRILISVAELESELKAYVPVEDLARLAQLVKDQWLTVRSEAFRATLEAQAEHPAGQMRAECLLSRNGRLLLWAER